MPNEDTPLTTPPATRTASPSTSTSQPSGGDKWPKPSTPVDESRVPQSELAVLRVQRDLDLDAARIASERAKSTASMARVAAQATHSQELSKYDAAVKEAGFTRDAARAAAELKYTTDESSAPKVDNKTPNEVVRVLEEQRNEAYHKAEVAYWTAVHKAELGKAAADANLAMAQQVETQVGALAAKNKELDEAKAHVKYYQALGKLFKK